MAAIVGILRFRSHRWSSQSLPFAATDKTVFFVVAFIPGLKSCIKRVQLKSNTCFLVVDMNEGCPKLKKAMTCKYVSI